MEKDNQLNELIEKTGINIGTLYSTTNIQNNIKILAYNKTDLSHLKDKFMNFLIIIILCYVHDKKLHLILRVQS